MPQSVSPRLTMCMRNRAGAAAPSTRLRLRTEPVEVTGLGAEAGAVRGGVGGAEAMDGPADPVLCGSWSSTPTLNVSLTFMPFIPASTAAVVRWLDAIFPRVSPALTRYCCPVARTTSRSLP